MTRNLAEMLFTRKDGNARAWTRRLNGEPRPFLKERLNNLPALEIDRHNPELMDAIAKAPLYKKQGQVRAEIAKGGEEIVTRLADGTQETKNVAQPGDAIVTNPGGEQYIIKSATFAKRYEPHAGEEGVYDAKGYCKAVKNPYGRPITMLASWGEMQNGNADCLLADTYDPATQQVGGQPYIIGGNEFKKTYKLSPKTSSTTRR